MGGCKAPKPTKKDIEDLLMKSDPEDSEDSQELAPGTRVRLHGLKTAVEFNDMLGTLRNFDGAKNGWLVILANGQVKGFRARNLEVLQDKKEKKQKKDKKEHTEKKEKKEKKEEKEEKEEEEEEEEKEQKHKIAEK